MRFSQHGDGPLRATFERSSPLSVANQRDRSGHTLPNSIRLQISKELPATFRLPGK